MAATNLQLAMLAERMWSCFQVVDPAEANMAAYGTEFRSILILAATEVEAQCKGILKANDYAGGSRWTTRDYVKLEPALRLADYSIGFLEYPWLQPISPFSGWSVDQPTESLPWYSAYNAVKHDREGNFPAASLENALAAVAAVVTIAIAQFGTPFMRGARSWGRLFSSTRRPKWTIGDTHGSFSDHGIEDEPIDYPFS
jgi:hypothetical protein